jgi:hypothetical protein
VVVQRCTPTLIPEMRCYSGIASLPNLSDSDERWDIVVTQKAPKDASQNLARSTPNNKSVNAH